MLLYSQAEWDRDPLIKKKIVLGLLYGQQFYSQIG